MYAQLWLSAYKMKGKEKLMNQVIYGVMRDFHEIVKEDCSLWDSNGECLFFTGENEKQEAVSESVRSALNMEVGDPSYETDCGLCFPVFNNQDLIYILCIHGKTPAYEALGRLGAKELEHLSVAYKEKVSKNKFFQNLILDNLLLVDIMAQAKKLKVDVEKTRVVFVIEPKKENGELILETLKGLYATGVKDFVTSVDTRHMVLVKALETTQNYRDVKKIAQTMVDTLNMEAMIDVRVAYGTIVEELKDVSRSYKEAAMALDVGRIFYAEKTIMGYNELGIGRLLYQLSHSLCEMFLKEVFEGRALEDLDEEMLRVVYAFFENDLNISETARKLYLHRNTLMYRLEKIQKMTGLDIRKFEDALTFKIALMVSNYMKMVQSEK